MPDALFRKLMADGLSSPEFQYRYVSLISHSQLTDHKTQTQTSFTMRFSSIATATALFLIGPAAAQLNQFDISDTGARFTCDPVPGVCDFNRTEFFASAYYGNIGVDSNSFEATSATHFLVGQCFDAASSCSVTCDMNCQCATGTIDQAANPTFTPDGGECSLLGTQPPRPTASPTFDPSDQIFYDGTLDGAGTSIMPDQVQLTCSETNARCLIFGGYANTASAGDSLTKTGNGNDQIFAPPANTTAPVVRFANCLSDECIISCDPGCECLYGPDFSTGTNCATTVQPEPSSAPAPTPSLAPTMDSGAGNKLLGFSTMATAMMVVVLGN